MKDTVKDGVPTRDTAKNPLMKELVETSPEIPPAVASLREEEEEEVQGGHIHMDDALFQVRGVTLY